ncbi:MAG: phosphatase PAP2 family protein [Paludibacteraceae bacterium]|nr:phosphatase PAP2 family protein [Paludibacteraceae bacterium]
MLKRLALWIPLIIICVGARAQYADSMRVAHKTNFTYKQLIVPSVLIATGLALVSNNPKSIKMELVDDRNRYMSSYKTTVDDYMQFSPIVIAYGLDALGVKSKTDIVNRTVILAKSELLMVGVTQLLKYTTHEVRPDGSNNHSFPSGHTAEAFAAATFLSEEYKDKLPWMPYVAYTISSGVGFSRMANNKHYICDVLVGAGIGILCTKVSYWTHQYRWGRKRQPKPVASF